MPHYKSIDIDNVQEMKEAEKIMKSQNKKINKIAKKK